MASGLYSFVWMVQMTKADLAQKCSFWTLPAYQESHQCERVHNLTAIKGGFACPHHIGEWERTRKIRSGKQPGNVVRFR